MLKSKLQKLNRSLQITVSIWVTMAFLLSAFSPVTASGITDRYSEPSANTDGFKKSIKDLAERPLISTPLRLRNLAVESLRPVTSEQAGQNTLALAMVNRIIEDNAAYFFDEGHITHSIVIAHDRELVQQLVRLLKDKRVSADKKQVYQLGLLNILLADRHIAELAVQALSNFGQYIRKNPITGELRFNERYFLRNLKQADPVQLLGSGKFEIEFYLNGPNSALLKQELLTQIGGTIAKYEFPKGTVREIQIIITAVSQ